MLKPTDQIIIQGSAGGLETIYLPAHGRERGVAVINHPNPRQGGTNTNKVIQTAAKALTSLGFHCYLPNLRGVGNSEGEHDYGRGETDDCTAVIDYARARHPDAPQFILGGFSFGGYVSLFAAQQREPDLLLLIGPAVRHYDTREPNAPDPAKTLLIHGETDEVVPLENAFKWAAPQDLPVIVLPESSHFFHGKLIALRHTVLRFVPAVLGK
ncbi:MULTISPECIES: alpha/beta hydrolase [unclassified Neisseria]|uniref:alpha/beta hydrolase n=1 Tax=unclassified Neisseria TaxID=2623750 RepID=UPI0026656E3E|nr:MULTISPECIES: alpha/beta hydrolase [unclassified Neisseria]MDO1508955.1 alpha/beta hydrolase [Neisseria sp. MVDL19-042950]MDO1515214.1 alpha/beta hydrolase [Neisseria sp. MVDL18-041461]MDO1562574.1 alpha/beta hydrolase [Neisseria sp. MVDL20-010259]